MISDSKKLYNLPNDILDNIFYKNEINNKTLAQIVMSYTLLKLYYD